MFVNLLNQIVAFCASIIFIDNFAAAAEPHFFSAYILIISYLSMIVLADWGVSSKVLETGADFQNVLDVSLAASTIGFLAAVIFSPLLIYQLISNGIMPKISIISVFAICFTIIAVIRVFSLTLRNIIILIKTPFISATVPNLFNIFRLSAIYFAYRIFADNLMILSLILLSTYVLELFVYKKIIGNVIRFNYNLKTAKKNTVQVFKFGGGFGLVAAIGIIAPSMEKIILLERFDHTNFTTYLYYSYFIASTLLVATSFNSYMFRRNHLSSSRLINTYIVLGLGLTIAYGLITIISVVYIDSVTSLSNMASESKFAFRENIYQILTNGFLYSLSGYMYFIIVFKNKISSFAKLQLSVFLIKVILLFCANDFAEYIYYDFWVGSLLLASYTLPILSPSGRRNRQ